MKISGFAWAIATLVGIELGNFIWQHSSYKKRLDEQDKEMDERMDKAMDKYANDLKNDFAKRAKIES